MSRERHSESALFIGLISGTSADAIDAVLVRFGPPGTSPELLAAVGCSYPAALRAQILALSQSAAPGSLDELARLDVAVGQCFAAATHTLLAEARVNPDAVRAIGSHGQTLRHGPHGPTPFTLQIGDPNVIAERTGIDVIADFRRRDVAAGGQGAPLVPAFHAALFGTDRPRAVLNLGGIANLTLLLPGQPVRGWDSGPANALMDAWTALKFDRSCDAGGQLASQGRVLPPLLTRLFEDDYFVLPPPKSTGRDRFHLDWLQTRLSGDEAELDVLATLLELTAQSVAQDLQKHAPEVDELLVCGGGVHNTRLLQRLGELLAPLAVHSTAALSVDPDQVEALAFAWLAREFLAGRPGNRAEVTGAAGPRRLGALFPAR